MYNDYNNNYNGYNDGGYGNYSGYGEYGNPKSDMSLARIKNLEYELEKKRKEAYTISTVSKMVIVFVIIIILYSNILITSLGGLAVVFQMLSVLVAIIVFSINSKKVKEYKLLYKRTIVDSVLKEQFDNVIYNGNKGFSNNEIREMNLIQMGNRFSSEDYISANYEGVNFVRSDVVIKHETSSGKHHYTVTYFRGRVYRLQFNKPISAGMQIKSNNFNYGVKPAYLNKNSRIETESEEFNDRFSIYTSSDQAAFYILTPQMMEKFMKFLSMFKSVNVNIIGNQMLIAVNSDLDSLEPTMNKPMIYSYERDKLMRELNEIKQIMELFNLKDDTYKNSNYKSFGQVEKPKREFTDEEINDMFMGNIG